MIAYSGEVDGNVTIKSTKKVSKNMRKTDQERVNDIVRIRLQTDQNISAAMRKQMDPLRASITEQNARLKNEIHTIKVRGKNKKRSKTHVSPSLSKKH